MNSAKNFVNKFEKRFNTTFDFQDKFSYKMFSIWLSKKKLSCHYISEITDILKNHTPSLAMRLFKIRLPLFNWDYQLPTFITQPNTNVIQDGTICIHAQGRLEHLIIGRSELPELFKNARQHFQDLDKCYDNYMNEPNRDYKSGLTLCNHQYRISYSFDPFTHYIKIRGEFVFDSKQDKTLKFNNNLFTLMPIIENFEFYSNNTQIVRTPDEFKESIQHYLNLASKIIFRKKTEILI